MFVLFFILLFSEMCVCQPCSFFVIMNVFLESCSTHYTKKTINIFTDTLKQCFVILLKSSVFFVWLRQCHLQTISTLWRQITCYCVVQDLCYIHHYLCITEETCLQDFP